MGARLKAFRKANDLTQDVVGEYLGIKKSFVSQLEHGIRPLSDKHMTCLLNNPYNWDTSALTTPTPSITAHASGSGRNKASVQIGGGSSEKIAALEKEVEMLRELLAAKEKENEFLRELLKK